MQVLKSKCYRPYKDSTKAKTWSQAREFCQKVTGPGNPGNGDLMSIHNLEQNQLLIKLQRTSYIFLIRNYWIGMNRRNNDDKCVPLL